MKNYASTQKQENSTRRTSVEQHLTALGYLRGDTVYIRAFYPSDDPRKNEDKGRKTQTKSLNHLIKVINQYQIEGRGVYIVVNGGGHTDKSVSTARAIFYEHDNLDKELQKGLWQQLGLPEPTFQVDTGGKSIHSYWVFDKRINVPDWKKLQADLLEFSDGDRSIKNPSRVMRLAGCYHSPDKNDNVSEIITNSGKRYSFEELRKIIRKPDASASLPKDYASSEELSSPPKELTSDEDGDSTSEVNNGLSKENCNNSLQTAQESVNNSSSTAANDSSQESVNNSSQENASDCSENQTSPNYQNNDEVPLTKCLTKHDRELINNGTSEGGRNVNGAKLARNLIGTRLRLQYLGIRFSGDPRQIFDEYCQRCNPALDPGEADKIWASAEKDNPSATLSDDAIENCVKAYWRNQKLVPPKKGKVKRSSEKGHNFYDADSKLPPDFEPNEWDDVPQSHNGELGFWKKKDNDEWYFSPVCNFDFVIEKELEDKTGGGFVLQFKRLGDFKQKRVIINSLDYTTPDKFIDKLKQEFGVGIVSKLNRKQLAGLIQARLIQYKTSGGGRIYKRIEYYGQQPDGVWVFKDKQFKKDGTPTTEEETGWIYNPSFSQNDFIPCPELAPYDPQALKRLVDASRDFFDEENIYQLLLMMGWAVAGLQFQTIVKKEGNFPLFNGFGPPGALKTIAAETCLSLIGTNWSDLSILSSASVSALYEHGSRTSSLPFFWDDPERDRKTEELAKNWYNCKSRKVRGNEQIPRSPMGFTSNHCFGGDQDATYTRFVRAGFEVKKDCSKQAYQVLREAMLTASGAFSSLIKIGYPLAAINAIEAELLTYLPQAHSRIAKGLAIAAWYAQYVVNLTNGSENIKQWIIKNICPEENDSDNSGDALYDYIQKLLTLEAESQVGAWNLKRDFEKDGKQYVAIFAANCWKLVDSRFQPATYNYKALKSLVVKAGGVAGTTVRFACDRDQVLAFNRAKLTASKEFPPATPSTVARKAWLIPAELFESSHVGNQDFSIVTDSNQQTVTPKNDYESTVAGINNNNCNYVTKKDLDLLDRKEEKARKPEKVPPSHEIENSSESDTLSEDSGNSSKSSYTELETTQQQSSQPVTNTIETLVADGNAVTENVLLIKEAIAQLDSEALQQYSNQWTTETKKEVLQELSQEDKQALKKLVAIFKTENAETPSAPNELKTENDKSAPDELTIETDNRVKDDSDQLINEKVCTSDCHEVLTTSPGQGFGDLLQSSQDVTQRSSFESSEKAAPGHEAQAPGYEAPAPGYEAPAPIREGSIVYPTTGKYKNKECQVSCTRNEEFWVRPVKKQPGTPSAMYQVHELSTQPVQVTEVHQPEKQQQINLFDYDLAEDEYLHSIDD